MRDISPFSAQGYTNEKLDSILNLADNADTTEEEQFLSRYVRTLISMAKREVVLRAELELIDGAISNRRVFDRFTTRAEKILFACNEAARSSVEIQELEHLLKIARDQQIPVQADPSSENDSLNKKPTKSRRTRKSFEDELESITANTRIIMARYGHDQVYVSKRLVLELARSLRPFDLDSPVEKMRMSKTKTRDTLEAEETTS